MANLADTIIINAFISRVLGLKQGDAGPITSLERFDKWVDLDSKRKSFISCRILEVLNMSDRDKDLDEKLELRLIAVTEDPTFQGKRNEFKNVFGTISTSDLEVEYEFQSSVGNSLH